jgi:hypothetical protein
LKLKQKELISLLNSILSKLEIETSSIGTLNLSKKYFGKNLKYPEYFFEDELVEMGLDLFSMNFRF